MPNNITYSSTNTEVATVTNEGVVTAVKRGVSIISADVNGSKGACEITVKAKQTLTITPSEKQLKVGETLQLQLTPTPANGAKIAFTSSDVQVASVSDKGLVTALKEGETTVTATVDGLKATSKITVVKAENPIQKDNVEVEIEIKSLTPTNCVAKIGCSNPQLKVFATTIKKDLYEKAIQNFGDYYTAKSAWWKQTGNFDKETFTGEKEISVKGTPEFPLPDNYDIVTIAFAMDSNKDLASEIVVIDGKTPASPINSNFNIDLKLVQNIGGGAKIKVTPSDKSVKYFWDLQPKDIYDQTVTDENARTKLIRLVQEAYIYQDTRTFGKGDAEINTTSFGSKPSGKEHYFVIFAFDEDKGIISNIFKIVFTPL